MKRFPLVPAEQTTSTTSEATDRSLEGQEKGPAKWSGRVPTSQLLVQGLLEKQTMLRLNTAYNWILS